MAPAQGWHFWWFLFVCLVCLLLSVLVVDDDGLLDYVQVLHQFSFVALNSRWPRVLIWNYCFCNAIERVKRPGGSHEGVGRKKKLGPVLGPLILFVTQNGAQKWNPKQGPKLDPNQAPKCNLGPQICTETQTRTCRDLHSAVCWAIGFNCATNQQLQPKKEGKLGRAKLLKQRAWIHSQTKYGQDMFYLQKIHSQVSRRGKSTASLLLWGYAHASPQNCMFWGPGFGTSFCSILRPLLATYCILGWQSSLQASGKKPCNLEAETKSKVGTAHRPGPPWRRMTIPMGWQIMNYDLHTWNYDPRIVKLRSANPLVSDRLRHSHLKLRPLHCQVTIRQSPCLWQITTLALEITTLALSSYDPPVPFCDTLRPSYLKLWPVRSQITTR